MPGAGGKEPDANLCQAANDAAIAAAKALVSASTLQRWAAVGVPVRTVADRTTSTGPGFLSSGLGWDTSHAEGVRVTGVSLATKTSALTFPGVYQCILLSPARPSRSKRKLALRAEPLCTRARGVCQLLATQRSRPWPRTAPSTPPPPTSLREATRQPRLHTQAKMVEWMMVDGLPKLGKANCSVC